MIYQVCLVLHVVTAIVALGPVVALALGVKDMRLARIASFGLLFMLLTGLGMLAVTDWVYVHTLWMRASGVGFVVIGGLLGRLRKAPDARPVAWAAIALTAVVAALMELKV